MYDYWDLTRKVVYVPVRVSYHEPTGVLFRWVPPDIEDVQNAMLTDPLDQIKAMVGAAGTNLSSYTVDSVKNAIQILEDIVSKIDSMRNNEVSMLKTRT